ncbi:YjbE family integral membrane protein [[Clostridium] ultunense Esp]|nr:YjbE family integral membrane protein [[Clostridium] ultunense Esp]
MDSLFELFTSLMAIILIDLFLAGDNAIVIGMAARNLPHEHQKKAIFWGTLGAVAVRVLLTIGVVYLLQIPFLLFVGGSLLVWIAVRLLIEDKKEEIKASDTLFSAIRTIIFADALMGMDNVLAVAGAAHGHPILVLIGLLISIPIVVWGSTLVIRALDHFPFLIYLGSGVLLFTAGKMITEEPFFHSIFDDPLLKWTTILLLIAIGLITGRILSKKKLRDVVADEGKAVS